MSCHARVTILLDAMLHLFADLIGANAAHSDSNPRAEKKARPASSPIAVPPVRVGGGVQQGPGAVCSKLIFQ